MGVYFQGRSFLDSGGFNFNDGRVIALRMDIILLYHCSFVCMCGQVRVCMRNRGTKVFLTSVCFSFSVICYIWEFISKGRFFWTLVGLISMMDIILLYHCNFVCVCVCMQNRGSKGSK